MKKLLIYSTSITVALCLIFSCTADLEMPLLPEDFVEPSSSGNSSSSSSVLNNNSSSSSEAAAGLLHDSRDDKTYRAIKIGEQTWMAENLNYNASGSKCYNNLEKNCGIYGRLYDWTTAKTVCPSGWHLPSNAEWTTLTNYVGGSSTAGIHLKATSGWINCGPPGSGNIHLCEDTYGFSALPGSGANFDGDFYDDAGYYGEWWSSTENYYTYAYVQYMGSDSKISDHYEGDKDQYLSVRCVKDEAPVLLSSSSGVSSSSSSDVSSSSADEPGIFTDPRDGQKYKYETAPNGSIWMSENLNYSKNGTVGWCYGTGTIQGAPGANSQGCDSPYGKVYTYSIAIDGNSPQGLCPDGWHMPSRAEWTAIGAGASGTAGTRRMSSGFYVYAGNYNLNSEYLPLGWRDRGSTGFWWTRDGNSYFVLAVGTSSSFTIESTATSTDYFSVRCVKN